MHSFVTDLYRIDKSMRWINILHRMNRYAVFVLWNNQTPTLSADILAPLAGAFFIKKTDCTKKTAGNHGADPLMGYLQYYRHTNDVPDQDESCPRKKWE